MINAEKILEIIALKESNYNFNDYIKNYIDEKDLENIESADELRGYLEKLNDDRNITDCEVIYYHNAMEYLKQFDNSLKESLDLAYEYCYDVKNINSELLASLHKSHSNLFDYNAFINEVIKEVEAIEDLNNIN